MGREFELKYKASAAQQAAIFAKWEKWDEFSMETTYFDTAEHTLSGKKCTLRCRLENGVAVCTLKTPISGFGRGEWDVESPWNEAAVTNLFAQASQPPVPFPQLLPICGARFTRFARTVELSECTVEIALDRGVLMGGNREIPLCEVEVELKSGSEAAAIAWAEQLALQHDLQPERSSKFRRASLLAKGE